MEIKLIFETRKGEYQVPENELLYIKNLEYFTGMGLYDEAMCHEKALLTTGYNVIRFEGQE